jgi:AbrB family looped-hinge helix DNA binding protein
MKTTIDNAGRIVVPKEIWRLAGLHSGMVLEVSWRDDHIEIEPAATEARLVKKGNLLVAEPLDEVGPLTPDQGEQARESILIDRGEQFLS